MWQLVLALALTAVAGRASAAGPCDPGNVGVADEATIDGFVKAVFGAISSGDCTRIAGVIGYPLVVNATDLEFRQSRSLVIETKGEFLERCDAIFTPGFRAAILRHQNEGAHCSTALLGFARGRLWSTVLAGVPLISTINQADFRWPNMTAGELLRCRTPEHLVVIDRPRDRLRYRAWSAGHESMAKPDLLIEGGDETREGTGVCAHPIGRFSSGNDQLVVSAFGCGLSDGPEGLVARLTVMKRGEAFQSSEEWKPCLAVPKTGDPRRPDQKGPRKSD